MPAPTTPYAPYPTYPVSDRPVAAHSAGVFGERPHPPTVGATPRSGGRPQPRRTKADSLRLVQRLKRGIVVSAIVAFGTFGGLVATRLPALGATTAAATSSSSGTTPSSSTSTSSGGFFGQGSSGSGVSGSSSSSASSSSPITTTSAS